MSTHIHEYYKKIKTGFPATLRRKIARFFVALLYAVSISSTKSFLFVRYQPAFSL